MTGELAGEAAFNKLSDQQLIDTVDFFTERLYHAERDLDEAIGHAALRGILPTVAEPNNVISMVDYKNKKALGL